jgi:hypothetical protein
VTALRSSVGDVLRPIFARAKYSPRIDTVCYDIEARAGDWGKLREPLKNLPESPPDFFAQPSI